MEVPRALSVGLHDSDDAGFQSRVSSRFKESIYYALFLSSLRLKHPAT